MVREAVLDISEARKQFNTLDERLESQPVIYITRHNKQAFAVVNIEYLHTVLETMDILADPEALAMMKRGLDDLRAGRVHEHDDVATELG